MTEEKQNIKLEKVDDKTAYENLLVKYAELEERYNKVDIIGYDALKNLTKAEDIIRALLFHLTNDTFYVIFETQEQSVERARQFLQRRAK